MSKHSLIAIDLAKNVFQVCGMNRQQRITFNKSLRRGQLTEFMAQQPPGEVAMEACYSSHYWARCFQTMGHTVKLLPAQHVKPFVRGNKSDRNDAVAIAEASLRPAIRTVPIKSLEQQDIQALHRLRDRYVASRTRLVNQTRGLLSEYGAVAPQGAKAFRQLLIELSQPRNRALTPILQSQLRYILDDYYQLSDRLDEINKLLYDIAHNHPVCRLLLTIPGIGPIVATALYSAIGNASQFKQGRDLAVWLGLTPRQFGSGEKQTSGGITKRGNRYLRKQLVHGARAALFCSKKPNDSMIQWARQVAVRRGANKASVALAARIARVAWVILQRQQPYQAERA